MSVIQNGKAVNVQYVFETVTLSDWRTLRNQLLVYSYIHEWCVLGPRILSIWDNANTRKIRFLLSNIPGVGLSFTPPSIRCHFVLFWFRWRHFPHRKPIFVSVLDEWCLRRSLHEVRFSHFSHFSSSRVVAGNWNPVMILSAWNYSQGRDLPILSIASSSPIPFSIIIKK